MIEEYETFIDWSRQIWEEPSENLTVFGDGGIFVTDDETLAEHCRILRDHRRKEKYEHELVGNNLRFNEIQAVMGRLQLERLKGFRVIEIPIAHHPRKFGVSKYNTWNRMLPAFVDLLAVKWMKSRHISYEIEERI